MGCEADWLAAVAIRVATRVVTMVVPLLATVAVAMVVLR